MFVLLACVGSWTAGACLVGARGAVEGSPRDLLCMRRKGIVVPMRVSLWSIAPLSIDSLPVVGAACRRSTVDSPWSRAESGDGICGVADGWIVPIERAARTLLSRGSRTRLRGRGST